MNKRKLNQIINQTIKKSKTELSAPEYQNKSQSSNNHYNKNHYNFKNKVKKEQIPKRIREFVWNTYNGENYSSKCYVAWCSNNINVFNYQVGHDIPESKGGSMEISNLKPICGNCNLSMGNKYTITEWSQLINLSNTTKQSIPLDIDITTLPDISNPHINLVQPDKIKVSENLEKYMIKLLNKTNIEIDELNKTQSINSKSDKYKLIAGLSMVIMVLGLFV
jgi:5-methylcytosine-specific restriction endonuclease McrA